MGNDIWIVLQWWGTLFLVGAVAFPLTKRLFNNWLDQGYLFSKAVGMAVITWIVYVLGTLHVMPFSVWSIVVAMVVLFIGGLVFQSQSVKHVRSENVQFDPDLIGIHSIFNFKLSKFWVVIFLEELFFLGALFLWSWVKGHEPSIHGLEKFMDYGFMKSILNSSYFPPADMWYAGLPINYYYFGHMVVAVLTKLSGLDLAYTFNLMLASIFAFTFTMSFSIGYQLSAISNQQSAKLKALITGLLTAFLVTLAGNMQTLYAFTKGYTGDAVKPFWTLLWGIGDIGGIRGIWGGELWVKFGEGMNRYWYANATRFIPYTIHEFPSYSFVVSDVHGHVLSLPFTLLAIALLIAMFETIQIQKNFQFPIFNFQSIFKFKFSTVGNSMKISNFKFQIIFYGFLVGVLLMTNALDGPIYLALFFLAVSCQLSAVSILDWRWWKEKGTAILGVAIVAVVTSLPFLFYFKSFVTGVAFNCPPAFLADHKFGPLLFEAVEKCQHSPLWMMWLLWGFFVYCGGWFIFRVLSSSGLTRGSAFFFVRNADSRRSLPRALTRGGNDKKVKTNIEPHELLLVVFFLFSLVLIIFPEFFYFKDIYPAHFRSNTMFKLGYQAFILFSIVAGYTIVHFLFNYPRESRRKFLISNFKFLNKRTLFFVFLIPQLFLVSIFPIFSVRSYFDSLRNYKGLNGLAWIEEQYPDDYQAIDWLNRKGCQLSAVSCQLNRTVLVEADGDSYTDHARFSAFTGLPTIIGWPVHEWLWRGSYDVVSPRRDVVRKIYESEDIDETKELLKEFNVSYVIVGTLERQKFQNINEDKLQLFGQIVFQQGETTIYKVEN